MMQKSKRLTQIKEYVSKHKDIQISELASFIDASESTIRRDIKDLALEGFLEERYGSIVLREKNTTDVFLDDRLTQNVDQKNIAAKKAAALIEDNDFVFLDAGTTTLQMVKHIEAKNAVFVTNGLNVASELSKYGFEVHLLGGQVKLVTLATVGEQAVSTLTQYHFDKCFIGTNGYSPVGYSTPDLKEGAVKKQAIAQSRKHYVVTDKSKENKTTSYLFAVLNECELITE